MYSTKGDQINIISPRTRITKTGFGSDEPLDDGNRLFTRKEIGIRSISPLTTSERLKDFILNKGLL